MFTTAKASVTVQDRNEVSSRSTEYMHISNQRITPLFSSSHLVTTIKENVPQSHFSDVFLLQLSPWCLRNAK